MVVYSGLDFVLVEFIIGSTKALKNGGNGDGFIITIVEADIRDYTGT